MRIWFALLVAVLMAVPAAAAPKKKIELYTREAVLAWIGDYRAAPDPARLPAAIKAMSQLGVIRDPEGSGVFVGFIAGVIAANPGNAEQLIVKALPLPSEHQWAIVRAIAYSGLPEWKDLMRRVAPRLPARSVMIEKHLAGKLPTLDQMAVDKEAGFMDRLAFTKYFARQRTDVALEPSPDALDALWGYYFATGSNSALNRIVAMLPWSKDRDSTDKVTLGSMAKYTLAINGTRYPEVLAALRRAAPQQPKSIKPILDDVIEAAETAETGRLRKEWLASVEHIRVRGPGTKRDISLMGQIGEGALAIGCIAAAVAGQVQLGVPCVVGGAATSAALRFWDRQ